MVCNACFLASSMVIFIVVVKNYFRFTSNSAPGGYVCLLDPNA